MVRINMKHLDPLIFGEALATLDAARKILGKPLLDHTTNLGPAPQDSVSTDSQVPGVNARHETGGVRLGPSRGEAKRTTTRPQAGPSPCTPTAIDRKRSGWLRDARIPRTMKMYA